MEKKLSLLFIAAMSTAIAAVGAVAISNGNADNFFNIEQKNSGLVAGDYTLYLNSENQIQGDNSVLTTSGNKIYFDTEGEGVNKNPDSGWFQFGSSAPSYVFNTTEIFGMKSITFVMDYYTSVYLTTGYKEGGVIHYSNYYQLTGISVGDERYQFSKNFTESRPTFFKIQCFSADKTIFSMNIDYECSDSGVIPTELSSFEFSYISETDSYRLDELIFDRDSMDTLFIPGTYDDGVHGEKPVKEIKSLACDTKAYIKNLIIGEGVETIGSMAFAYCVSLSNIVLPSTLKNIDSDAFSGCISLTSLNIPAETTDLELSALTEIRSLETITVSEGNPKYYAEDGMLFAYTYKGYEDALLVCPAGKTGKITIKDECEFISDSAFKNSKASTIRIGSGVTNIEENFRTCKSLLNFEVEAGNLGLSAVNGLLCTSDGEVLIAYPRGRTDTEVTMPQGINRLYDEALYDVDTIRTLYLNEVAYVGENALANMDNLQTVYFDNAYSIDEGAFKNDVRLSSISLPIDLRDIPDECFMGCTSLASISLPTQLRTIGVSAFKGCTSLSSLALPNIYFYSIGAEAFMNCTSLAIDLVISDSVTSCGKGAFKNTGITDFTFTMGMNNIPDECFMDCDSLTVISIPLWVETIGYDAFNGCDRIRRVNFPDSGITTIKSKAFLNCSSLAYIFVPKCITSIETSGFNTGHSFDIYTDVGKVGGSSVYSSATSEIDALRSGWNEHLGGGALWHVYYESSRSQYEEVYNSHYPS